MSGSNLGAEIDANEVVVRFNNAPTKGYEKDVGKKTSLRLTNAIFQGYREKDDEACVSQMVPGTETEPRAVRTTRGVEAFGREENARFEPTVYRVCQFEVFSKAREHAPVHGYDVALVAQVRKSHAVRIQRENMKRWYYPKRRKGESAPNKKDWLREKRWTVDGEWLHARSSGGLLDTNLGGRRRVLQRRRGKCQRTTKTKAKTLLSLVPGAVLESSP